MAILAYLSRRRAALRGSGMRSSFARCPRRCGPRSGPKNPVTAPRKSGTHCAAEKPHQRAPNRTGTVAHALCARPLRRTFAQDLCARALRIFSLPYRRDPLGVRLLCTVLSSAAPEKGCPVQHQRGCPRTRGGQNGGSDPPVCALRAALTPGCNAHHLGQCRPPCRGSLPP